MIVERADLAAFVRFASRLTSRAPMPVLRCCLFSSDSAVVTDLDVALRGHLPGVRDIGVLVPAPSFKRFLSARQVADIQIERVPNGPEDLLRVLVNGAVFSGHDPREFPAVTALFPAGEPIARARFGTLEPVLVAASTDERRQAMCAVFFQLCKNLAVATNGHVLHTLDIESADRGDFLVPRRTVELVENIRKAIKTAEVEAHFFEHQAVFRVDRFEVASKLETENFRLSAPSIAKPKTEVGKEMALRQRPQGLE